MRILDRLIKPSTRAFIREARQVPGYSFGDFLHGYIYLHWIYQYIGISEGELPAPRWFLVLAWLWERLSLRSHSTDQAAQLTYADTYHGKAVPLSTAELLVHVHHDVEVHDLEQIIPYKRARAIILHNPDHIVVLDCPCRAAREHPCLPLDVCLVVGEPFASFAREHHPQRSRWITADEAVAILEAEDQRGHVHHAFFKDAALDRFFAICNCCKCCCGAMQAHQNGNPMLASSGFITVVDETLCDGCSECVSYCQFEALSVADGVGRVEYEKCMGCGVCTDKCGQGALSLVLDPAKGTPLEVCSLMSKALPLGDLDAATYGGGSMG